MIADSHTHSDGGGCVCIYQTECLIICAFLQKIVHFIFWKWKRREKGCVESQCSFFESVCMQSVLQSHGCATICHTTSHFMQFAQAILGTLGLKKFRSGLIYRGGELALSYSRLSNKRLTGNKGPTVPFW